MRAGPCPVSRCTTRPAAQPVPSSASSSTAHPRFSDMHTSWPPWGAGVQYQPNPTAQPNQLPTEEALLEIRGASRGRGGGMLAVGDEAPDFTATDCQGAPVRLSSLRGRRVVLFF
ncbi:MAG TPA: redoxin domain-containing protein, partial [Myxococcus sp.]|nr:redoxin domain-containing protein [Myxococcus sp.]